VVVAGNDVDGEGVVDVVVVLCSGGGNTVVSVGVGGCVIRSIAVFVGEVLCVLFVFWLMFL
jgi:hypothetical protein